MAERPRRPPSDSPSDHRSTFSRRWQNQQRGRADARARRKLVASAVMIGLLVGALATAATVTPTVDRSGGSAPAASTVDPQVASIHANGITGERVRIGVVDVTGFERDHPNFADRVVTTRAFGPGKTVRNGGRNAHGTAAASTVARVAPDADLYLAAFATPDSFQRAVEWLVRQDADVIVAPVSFYGLPGDGSSGVARTADWAADRGVVFVAPTGNLGRGHWAGRFRPDDRNLAQFGSDVRNHLDGPREIVLWLSWPRQVRHLDFTLELYADDGNDSRLVARSQPSPGDDVPNERIVARVAPAEGYYFVLRGPPNASGVLLEVSSPTHVFQYRDPAESVVAPGSARSAITVGAYDRETGRVEPYSSQGPGADGRLGVDVLAPSRVAVPGDPEGFEGSSAAATYAAGVAALVLDANSQLSPQQVEAILQRSATDVDRAGVDPTSGHGRLAVKRAVRVARHARG